MSDEVSERAHDLTLERDVSAKLQDFALTGASAEWLTEFLEDAVTRDVLPWQVGEAIAGTVLENSHGVVFPWNTRRDERNPRASLAGADLVGISIEAHGSRLVFGEVKSSSHQSSPPSVVTGKSGMTKQLERLIDDKKLQYSLIKWLFARIDDESTKAAFDDALSAFVHSRGESVRLVGVLVRDTTPRSSDVSARGKAIGNKVSAPGSVELHAMYMPRPMADWVEWVDAA